MTPGIVAESDLLGNLQSEYVFFNGRRVARKDFHGNTVSYYFSDQLKTASVITDAVGTTKSESDNYPWGGELQFLNGDSNHYKFTGKERDAETGLDYFGARHYSNGLGRWITPDWAAKATAVPYADFADPQSLNLYTFVRNIPTTKYDADGHEVYGQVDVDLNRAANALAQAFHATVSFLTTAPPPHMPTAGGPLIFVPCTCSLPERTNNKNEESKNSNNSKSENAAGEQGGSKDSRAAQDPLRRDANGKAVPDPEAEGA